MRILVITDLFPPVAFGGYELECAALVQRLRGRHDVTVLTSDRAARRVPVDPAVRRVLPAAGGNRVLATLAAPLQSVRAARRTRRVLADVRPDVVYVANGIGIPQAATVIAAGAGVPVVIRLSELWYARNIVAGDRFLRELRPDGEGDGDGVRGLWARAARSVNRVPALRIDLSRPLLATVSWASEALRRDAGVPELVDVRAQRVIHPGSSRQATYAAMARRPAAEPTIAYAGRVTTAKGAEVACRAVAALRAGHGVDARLLYAGTCAPAMRRRLRRLARRLGVSERIELLGALGEADLGELLARTHAVVLPTLEHDAFPLVALEAAAARAPVVAARVGGLPEALPHGCALSFAPGDAAACAAALAATLADAAATEKRVARAFERARAVTVDAYLDASEELIADAR
jgi:glycosyltransferase involved in cell wall biosynthesis